MNPKRISQRIENFRKRFGEAHLYLAYHAAFPMALTPDLVYRIWVNFQRDNKGNVLKSEKGRVLDIPWIAVADVLLSNFCEEVGHELYEMEQGIRNELLKRLRGDARFGKARIDQLSHFLLKYIDDQLNSDDSYVRGIAESQRWIVNAYVRPNEVARELAEALSEKVKANDKPGVIRVASLVGTVAEPLVEAGFEPLLIYAEGMKRFVRGDVKGAESQIERYKVLISEGKLPENEAIKVLQGLGGNYRRLAERIKKNREDTKMMVEPSASKRKDEQEEVELSYEEIWNTITQSRKVIYHFIIKTLTYHGVPYTEEDIEELWDDVFIQLSDNNFHRLKQYDKNKGSLLSWIMPIAQRITLNKIRKNKILNTYEWDEMSSDIVEETDIIEKIDNFRKRSLLTEAMKRLSKDDKYLLKLYYFQNCSLKEIADSVGATQSNTAKMIRHATERLKKMIEKE